jgi:hypothetical protein
MSEIEETEETQETEKTQEVELTPAEKIATEGGWMPEEDFNEVHQGDKEWVSAAEFNRRGELFEKINSQSRKIDQLMQSQEMLKDTFRGAKAAEYERAKRDLMVERDTAIEDGEKDKVAEIEHQINQINAVQYAPEPQPAPTRDPEFDKWLSDNQWYGNNNEMRMFADSAWDNIAKQSGANFNPTEMYGKVGEMVRKAYPDQFQRKTPQQVGKPKASGNRSSKGVSVESLPEEYRYQHDQMVKKGLSSKDIIKQWVDMGAIE